MTARGLELEKHHIGHSQQVQRPWENNKCAWKAYLSLLTFRAFFFQSDLTQRFENVAMSSQRLIAVAWGDIKMHIQTNEVNWVGRMGVGE